MTKGWATIAIGLLAAIAVIAGLVVTGGPGHARKERRDQQRDGDLASLADMVACLARENGNRLPDQLAPSPQCNWQTPLTDAFSGRPYRYEVTGPRSYRLCADFDLPPPAARGMGARNAEGCVSREFLPDPASTPGAEATIPWRG